MITESAYRLTFHNDDLDQQHRLILRSVEAIVRARAEHRQKRFVENLLFELVDAVVIHFCAEEVAMKETGYPSFGLHSHLHAALLDHMIRVVYDYHSNLISLTDEIVDNLRNSFLIHMQTQDRELGVVPGLPQAAHPGATVIRIGATAGAASPPRWRHS